MVHDFQKSWTEVLNSVDEGVRSLVLLSQSSGGREFLSNLGRGEAGLCIELLDRGLTKHSLGNAARQSVLIVQIELSKRRRKLPDSIMITEKTMATEGVYTSGGSWEIRRGSINEHAVAVKTPRFSATTDVEKIRERFCREVILWNTLAHPNVLGLAGVLGSIGTSNFSTVSEWMAHGTLVKYIKERNPNRLDLLHGVAQGLKYMHDTNVVHAGVKASNVLITNESPPRACLSGFGSIFGPVQEYSISDAADAADGLKWRYLAPELIHPSKFGLKGVEPSREADVYALGLLVLEVLTGKVPFDGTRGLHLACSIVNGDRPTKPKNTTTIGLSDSLWELLQACWDGDRTRRPRMQYIEDQISNAAARWERQAPRRRSVPPLSLPPGDLPPSPIVPSSSSSSAGTRYSSAPDESQLTIPIIKIDVAGPDENNPDHMQEFYPPPSPISPSQPGSFSNESMIKRLDGVLEQGSVAEQERARLLNQLCKLCYRHQNFPESAKIPDCYNDSMTAPVWCGEVSCVFKGSYQSRPVAVKVFRINASNREVTFKKFCKEAVIWRHLRHPNIHPLLGVTISSERFSMVSDWTENGTINQFIKTDPDANRVDLLIDVVMGLSYMHKLPVAHGDLNGKNILINQDGRACLTDFGLSTIVGVDARLDPLDPDLLSVNRRDSLMSFVEGGSYPWMSPELLDLDEGNYRPTKESDIYALGMVIYEVLCGTVPFGNLARSFAVVAVIMKGTRPKKPEDAASLGFTDGLWEIVERCWLIDKRARPTLQAILSCLEEATLSWGDRWEVV